MHKGIDSYDYEVGGKSYARIRQTDPHIAKQILVALGDAPTVLNVGAGTGSYEPQDRYVMAVEPSSVMRAQRDPSRPAINATAETLPFDDNSFDASMACLTIHHWPDLKRGLLEMRRVTRGPIVLMTFDPTAVGDYWLSEYCPEMPEADGSRFPTIDTLRSILRHVNVYPVQVPLQCVDGFQEAFYGRPEMLLDPEIRNAQSGWSFVPEGAEDRFVRMLTADLGSGDWDRKYGFLRAQSFYEGALRLVVSPS
jgi:SAM-dependent methyltransferase